MKGGRFVWDKRDGEFQMWGPKSEEEKKRAKAIRLACVLLDPEYSGTRRRARPTGWSVDNILIQQFREVGRTEPSVARKSMHETLYFMPSVILCVLTHVKILFWIVNPLWLFRRQFRVFFCCRRIFFSFSWQHAARKQTDQTHNSNTTSKRTRSQVKCVIQSTIQRKLTVENRNNKMTSMGARAGGWIAR